MKKINVYVLYVTWNTNKKIGMEILGISENLATLKQKLNDIAENKAELFLRGKDYDYTCAPEEFELSGDDFYELSSVTGYARFEISQEPIPWETARKISENVELVYFAEDVKQKLRDLDNIIEPWKSEYVLRNQKILKQIYTVFSNYQDCNVPYNFTLDFAVREVMDGISMDKEVLEFLWDEFGDIPVEKDESIAKEFLGFPIGTHREEVWHWFDERYPGGVVRLMTDNSQ